MLNNNYNYNNKTLKEENGMLPVSEFRDEIIGAVIEHRYTIISARPASGKSTLVPQYLANYFDKVIVTNPRVIVAITLAMYVANQMDVKLGEMVGYRTGYDKCASRDTVIEYCTDAFHLVSAIWNENRQKDMVLVIDEVHEWTQATEALVGWCKFMADKWNMKIVIMSATMETEKIAKYFGEDTYVFDIPGTVYDVEVIERPASFLEYCIRKEIADRRNVQVFLPSKKEIYRLMEELRYAEAVVLPLHGDLSFEEQQRCFELYNLPLVVLSTNIGQTGLTIPRINSVVDTGKAIIPIAKNGIEELCEVDISQADIEQRMWRSARTGNGRYTLCSDTPIELREKYPVPEIQRSLLEQVVLRFAVKGIDMEQMEFFHQPDVSAIRTAKELLKSLGAFDDNCKVTEIGHKMSKMPVSVECARMIVEAEKHGCVEQVLIISTIVGMGGLLERCKGRDEATAGRYYDFTDEDQSDLIAELDVWNYLNSLEEINFKAMRINKRNFIKIKKHIKKLHDALSGVVEFSSSNDREAILKSCICAYSSRIFVEDYEAQYFDENEIGWKLDSKSCVNSASDARFVVGKPITVPGYFGPMNLLTFATRIDRKMLTELVPNEIESSTEISYEPYVDAVQITDTKRFRGYYVSSEVYLDNKHPQLAELRAKYNMERRRIEEENRRYFGLGIRQERRTEVRRQESVIIDGMPYVLEYMRDGTHGVVPAVSLGEEKIYTLEENEIFLEDGSKVWFKEYFGRQIYSTLANLRERHEAMRLAELRSSIRESLQRTVIKTIYDANSRKDSLGKFVLTKDNGGYGENDIFAYKCLVLKGDIVRIGLVSEEEEANQLNSEALKHLFVKEIANNYRDGKFSHIPGKKKKVLTEAEQKKKTDFDSFVRDVMHELTLEDALDSLQIVEDYYQELMSK